MIKIIATLLLSFVILVGADESYVFEAKGEFAKELKALVEKYSKEGKIEAKVYKKSDGIINSILNKYDENLDGKELFTKKCSNCHGKKGEEEAGAGSRIIKNLSKDDFLIALRSYQLDDQYGGSMKMLMQSATEGLRENEAEAIYSYLKGEKTLQNSTNVEKNQEESSSYLQ